MKLTTTERKITEEERLACALVAAQERIAALTAELAQRDQAIASLRAAEAKRLADEVRAAYKLPASFSWSRDDKGAWTLRHETPAETTSASEKVTQGAPEATLPAP